MKSTTYARLILFLPYLCLSGTWASLIAPVSETGAGIALQELSFAWAYSALFWAVPYFHVVLCLLIWSRRKSFQTIAIIYSLAPCALAAVTLTAYAIVQVAIWVDTGEMGKDLDSFAATSLFTVLVDLVVGYLFVGIALLGFVVLKRMGFIQAEQVPQSMVQPSVRLPSG